MYTLIVAEVNTLLYALAIPDKSISKVLFIEIMPELERLGERPFHESEKLARNICDILKIDYEFFSTSDPKFIEKLISPKCILDMSVTSYFKITRLKRKKSLLISGAVEQTFINSPSFFKGINPRLKLRLDLLRKIFIPLRIFSFYSLGNKNTILPLVHTKSIDFAIFKTITHDLLPQLLKKIDLNHRDFSNSLGNRNAAKTLLVLPRPREHGGSFELNLRIINESINHGLIHGFDQVVVKNHPMDNSDYSCLPIIDNPYSIIFLRDVKQRMFPLELLINFYHAVSFYGVFSMATFTLSRFLCETPHVFIPSNDPLFEYTTGNILKNMDHVPYFSSW